MGKCCSLNNYDHEKIIKNYKVKSQDSETETELSICITPPPVK